MVTGKCRVSNPVKIITNRGEDNDWRSQISTLPEVNYYILQGVSLSSGLGGYSTIAQLVLKPGCMIVRLLALRFSKPEEVRIRELSARMSQAKIFLVMYCLRV